MELLQVASSATSAQLRTFVVIVPGPGRLVALLLSAVVLSFVLIVFLFIVVVVVILLAIAISVSLLASSARVHLCGFPRSTPLRIHRCGICRGVRAAGRLFCRFSSLCWFVPSSVFIAGGTFILIRDVHLSVPPAVVLTLMPFYLQTNSPTPRVIAYLVARELGLPRCMIMSTTHTEPATLHHAKHLARLAGDSKNTTNQSWLRVGIARPSASRCIHHCGFWCIRLLRDGRAEGLSRLHHCGFASSTSSFSRAARRTRLHHCGFAFLRTKNRLSNSLRHTSNEIIMMAIHARGKKHWLM